MGSVSAIENEYLSAHTSSDTFPGKAYAASAA